MVVIQVHGVQGSEQSQLYYAAIFFSSINGCKEAARCCGKGVLLHLSNSALGQLLMKFDTKFLSAFLILFVIADYWFISLFSSWVTLQSQAP